MHSFLSWDRLLHACRSSAVHPFSIEARQCSADGMGLRSIPLCAMQLFTFEHPNWSEHIDNTRYKQLTFEMPLETGSTLVHGEGGRGRGRGSG